MDQQDITNVKVTSIPGHVAGPLRSNAKSAFQTPRCRPREQIPHNFIVSVNPINLNVRFCRKREHQMKPGQGKVTGIDSKVRDNLYKAAEDVDKSRYITVLHAKIQRSGTGEWAPLSPDDKLIAQHHGTITVSTSHLAPLLEYPINLLLKTLKEHCDQNSDQPLEIKVDPSDLSVDVRTEMYSIHIKPDQRKTEYIKTERQKLAVRIAIEKFVLRALKNNKRLIKIDPKPIIQHLFDKLWAEVQDLDFELSDAIFHFSNKTLYKKLRERNSAENLVVLLLSRDPKTMEYITSSIKTYLLLPEGRKKGSCISRFFSAVRRTMSSVFGRGTRVAVNTGSP